jgi:hypothetical protein
MVSTPDRNPNVHRRTVLKRGLVGGAVLALGGLGYVGSRRSKLRTPPGDLTVFDALEYSVLFAVAERVVLPAPSMPPLSEVDPVANADRTLRLADEPVLNDIRRLVRLFENPIAGFLFDGRAQPFTALSPEAQDEVLADWRDSRLEVRRTGYVVLRTLVAAAYYGDARTHAAVGYPGPPGGFHQPDAPVWKGEAP